MNQSGRVITPISRARTLLFSRSERVGDLGHAGGNVIGVTGHLVSRDCQNTARSAAGAPGGSTRVPGRLVSGACQNRARSAPAPPNLSGPVLVVGTKNNTDLNADV